MSSRPPGLAANSPGLLSSRHTRLCSNGDRIRLVGNLGHRSTQVAPAYGTSPSAYLGVVGPTCNSVFVSVLLERWRLERSHPTARSELPKLGGSDPSFRRAWGFFP